MQIAIVASDKSGSKGLYHNVETGFGTVYCKIVPTLVRLESTRASFCTMFYSNVEKKYVTQNSNYGFMNDAKN